jgi:hypothetical protein
LILFFIYNKHFQVNGNIDPVDEGGNAPQAAENEIRVALTSSWPGFARSFGGRVGRVARAGSGV